MDAIECIALQFMAWHGITVHFQLWHEGGRDPAAETMFDQLTAFSFVILVALTAVVALVFLLF